MFENATTADETVSRRSVLKTTGGLVAGTTALATFGAGRGAAETEEGLRIEVREMTEEYVAVDVVVPEAVYTNDMDLPTDTVLGLADRFVIHEDGEWVSLPEETDGLATPAHFERVNERGEWPKRYLTYFRTRAIDLPEAREEVTLGLGLFTERTVPAVRWASCPGHRDY